MRQTHIYSTVAIVAICITGVASRNAISAGQGVALVRLQSTTPGVQQVGNMNLSGTARANQFEGGGAGLSGVNADLLDGLDSSSFLQSVPLPLTLNGTHPSHIILGQNAATISGSSALIGTSTAVEGQTNGVFGQSASTSGVGVYGYTSSPTGATYGMVGYSQGTEGRGVYGLAGSTTGANYGVYAATNSKDGYGLFGLNTGTSYPAYAGYFQSNGGAGLYATGPTEAGRFIGTQAGGRGIVVKQTATAGYAISGEFEVSAPDGTALRGYSKNTGGGYTFGVGGSSDGSGGRGVDGYCDHATGQTYGVIGQVRSPNGWALFSVGRFGATGTKDFRIDHPKAPLEKFLFHYCSEGPEPMNAYSGTITTDAKGYANVELPDYYADINKNERIQLTIVDEDDSETFAQAKVIGLVMDGSFRIRTSAPGVKVFWRLEAVRNDAWVRRYGAPLEQEKVGNERGKYQQPELYDAPEEMGMYYHPTTIASTKKQ